MDEMQKTLKMMDNVKPKMVNKASQTEKLEFPATITF